MSLQSPSLTFTKSYPILLHEHYIIITLNCASLTIESLNIYYLGSCSDSAYIYYVISGYLSTQSVSQ